MMCPVEIVADGRIEDSSAPLHVDFADKFVCGGCLENDFNMEEILFAANPELIVAKALCSYLQDEEAQCSTRDKPATPPRSSSKAIVTCIVRRAAG